MKTRYGRALVREVSKRKEANYKIMRKIAKEIKTYKAEYVKELGTEYDPGSILLSEFHDLRKKNEELQQYINDMCYLETFLNEEKKNAT